MSSQAAPPGSGGGDASAPNRVGAGGGRGSGGGCGPRGGDGGGGGALAPIPRARANEAGSDHREALSCAPSSTPAPSASHDCSGAAATAPSSTA